MSLIDDIHLICDRLSSRGWKDLLLEVTANQLDIQQSTSSALEAALGATLATVDRSRGGFEDFHPNGRQGVAAGRPALSLLYHALASSQVHPTVGGEPSANPDDYPTLEELDTVENYIYSLSKARIDWTAVEVAVFAYQYRESARTTHRRHADLAFSRTGVARIGTEAPFYDPMRRGFWIDAGTPGIPVLPARYGVFLARRGRAETNGTVLGGFDPNERFLFPFHKLFDGPECLRESDLKLHFAEYHRNEKLHRIHRLAEPDGGLTAPIGFEIDQFPYIRDSINGGDLVSLHRMGASVLVVPTPAPALVRTVSQHNASSASEQIVHFVVPRSPRITKSSLMIPADGRDRLAPEYVNIRHRVDPAGPPDQKPFDLNTLDQATFETLMEEGGYATAHFTDDSADGCVESVVSGLPDGVGQATAPAFSLVTAPDFFPLADQAEVENDPTIVRVRPLSRGRLPVNPGLPRPSTGARDSFPRNETTVTAIVGATATGPEFPKLGQRNLAVSYLPDAASDIFAPGWDVSRSRDRLGAFLTSFGLGSPFPEDAKLCAAIASFWPAVAPDNGRTFGNEGDSDIPLLNQLPMLDEELGFHPDHDRVQTGEVASFHGWDGEFGPFFETDGNIPFVNHVAIERSDYVSQALAGRIQVKLTAEVQSEELIARHQALVACARVVQPEDPQSLCLVVFRQVRDWGAAPDRGDARLSGPGYLLIFARLGATRHATRELLRVRRKVELRHTCQVGSNGISYQRGNTPFRFSPI